MIARLHNIRDRIKPFLDLVFPECQIYQRNWSLRQQAIIFIILFTSFSLLSYFVPANGFIAFDWINFFSKDRYPPFYPPWDIFSTHYLSWGLFLGISLASISLSVLLRSKSAVSSVAAFLALPVLWTMFLGQLEGLVILGLLGLPYLVPIALLKPQVSFFALGAKRSYITAGIVWLIISLFIWGFWPARMLATNSNYSEGRYVQDISIGLAGIIVALPLFWFSRGDMDMLMLSGAFMTPHLIPYNMLPFTPSIARLKPFPAIIACILSWLPLSSNWLGNRGWWAGWLFVIWLWGALAYRRYKKSPG